MGVWAWIDPDQPNQETDHLAPPTIEDIGVFKGRLIEEAQKKNQPETTIEEVSNMCEPLRSKFDLENARYNRLVRMDGRIRDWIIETKTVHHSITQYAILGLSTKEHRTPSLRALLKVLKRDLAPSDQRHAKGIQRGMKCR